MQIRMSDKTFDELRSCVAREAFVNVLGIQFLGEISEAIRDMGQDGLNPSRTTAVLVHNQPDRGAGRARGNDHANEPILLIRAKSSQASQAAAVDRSGNSCLMAAGLQRDA